MNIRMRFLFTLLVLLAAGAATAQDTLRFAWITDLHFGKTDYNGEALYPDLWLKQCLYGIPGKGASFIFLGGDLSDRSGDATLYQQFEAAMQTSLPWYPMPGNHDVGDSSTATMNKLNLWLSRGYGRGPNNREFYGLTVGNLAAFYVLNTQALVANDPTVHARAEVELAEMDSFFTANAGIPRKFVCGHVPLFIQTQGEGDDYFNIPNTMRSRIIALMKKHGVTHYIAGHRHVQSVATDGGITVYQNTALSFQLGTGNQRGYYIFTVTADSVMRTYSPPIPYGSYEVKTSVTGGGRVVVDPNQLFYARGSVVHLTAVPDSGWRFQEWQGGHTGTSAVDSAVVDTVKNIQAVFVELVKHFPLEKRALGMGQITATPDGGVYAESTSVSLHAEAAPGWSFAGWSGAAEGYDNPTTVAMLGGREVKALFNPDVSSAWTLRPVQDSYVRGSVYASRNFNGDSLLRVREGTSDLYRCRALLQFDLRDIGGPNGWSIEQAVLRLHTRTGNAFADGTPGRVDVLAAGSDSWTETTLTWKTQPVEVGAVLDSVTAMVNSDRLYMLDITSLVKAEYAGDRTLSLLLKDETGGDRTVDFDSRETAFPPALLVATTMTDGAGESQRPLHFCLNQNYPNPFNPTTWISYELAASGPVRLAVYDMLGREVALLVNAYQNPGHYRAQFDARGLATGIYIYRLHASQFVDTHTMLVLK